MPGPKMGERPADFDEALVRQSPTFLKWSQLADGQSLRYACREFIKGHADDEERLMRRIMIARRNNLRDHSTLKKARLQLADQHQEQPKRKRRPSTLFSDAQVAKEMDVPAVEATRSYRSWMALEPGATFVYNQKYVKGREGHDWLLRKNIWRRMRYRRENKQMVDQLRHDPDKDDRDDDLAEGAHDPVSVPTTLSVANIAKSALDEASLHHAEGIQAAISAVESYSPTPTSPNTEHSYTSNPSMVHLNASALDAAARLAATTHVDEEAVAAAAAAAAQPTYPSDGTILL
eukprot:Nitzschia sp. Nitz4//scaffold130_size63480//2137//3006//NITZ4_006236-RA/size63480-processed-gene-0.85-mRNA-1//-1//CDS//3329535150//5261//frame0